MTERVAFVPPSAPAEAWVPRPYPQLLRGPAHRWWRPLAGLGLVLVGVGAVFVWTSAVLAGAAAVGLLDVTAVEQSFDEWWLLLLTNLGLAALVPISMAAVWLGHGWQPRWLSSVAGRVRWRWMGVVVATSTTVLVVATLVLWALTGSPSGSGSDVAVLLVVVALTTPLQAAGEEYLFRGWMSQAVGSLLRNAAAGAVLAAVLTSVLFALAHGGQNVWLFLDRLAFGLLASWLVWRTGGLEAAIAVHAVNNVVVFVPTIVTGGLDEALLVSQAPPSLVAADIVAMLVLAAVVDLLARRRRLRRLFVPPVLARPAPLG